MRSPLSAHARLPNNFPPAGPPAPPSAAPLRSAQGWRSFRPARQSSRHLPRRRSPRPPLLLLSQDDSDPTMPRSDEAEAFFHAVYEAVRQIPRGRVTSYGHIARLVGTPERPRQVGICLKHLPSASSTSDLDADADADANSDSDAAPRQRRSQPRHHDGNVPWQRVINAKGVISPRSNHPLGSARQATALRAEGVVVERNALGELRVDLAVYGWFPGRLRGGDMEGDESGNGDEDQDDDEHEAEHGIR